MNLETYVPTLEDVQIAWSYRWSSPVRALDVYEVMRLRLANLGISEVVALPYAKYPCNFVEPTNTYSEVKHDDI